MNITYNYWRSLERDETELLKVKKRIQHIIERGLKRNTQQNFGFVKDLLKEHMDNLKTEIIELEIRDEKTQRMKEKAKLEKKREQKSLSRTLSLIRSHSDFFNSAKQYQIQSPNKRLASFFDVVKSQRKSMLSKSDFKPKK